MDKRDVLALADAAESAAVAIEAPDFMNGNPYVLFDKNGRPHLQGVPAVVWWLDHPSMGLSHVRYNVLTGRIDAEFLPWDPKPHPWTDADTSQLYNELQTRTGGLLRSRPDLYDALIVVAHKREYDPLLDMLDGLDEWDGAPRADTILIDLLGAEDTPYTRAVTRHMENGAIMRAYHPGCKFDDMVVLVGAQGGRKSSLVRMLNMNDMFFTDTLGDIRNKESSENLQGAWIVEVGELEGLRKREAETVKLFVSKREDKYRASYGKFSEIRPRRCIFIGTTNSTAFLQDRTGNRRFLPVACDLSRATVDLFTEDIGEYIKQVWAEVIHTYRGHGFLPLVLPEEFKADAEEHQRFYSVDDAKEGLIADWIHSQCDPGYRVCILELAENVFDIQRADAVKPANRLFLNEISQMLDNMPDLERMHGRPKHSDRYGQQRCWEYRPVR